MSNKCVYVANMDIKITTYDGYCDTGSDTSAKICKHLWELDGSCGCHIFGAELKHKMVNGIERTIRCKACKDKTKDFW